MNDNTDSDKLDWMYKGASGHIDREQYLLGKSVDKSFEQHSQEEKDKKLGISQPKNHVEHECIPPSIRDFNKIVREEQVDLSAKLQEDPLVAIKKQEEEARRQFLQNPIQLKKLQEALKSQEKKKKKQKKRKYSDSEDDLDKQLTEKLKYLKGNDLAKHLLKKKKKINKDVHLDTILMHKFNELKDKLSQKDMDDILAGRSSDCEDDDNSGKKQKNSSSNSDQSDSGGRSQQRRGSQGQSNRTKSRDRYERKYSKQKFTDKSSDSECEVRKGKKDKYRKQKERKDSSDDGDHIRKNSRYDKHGYTNRTAKVRNDEKDRDKKMSKNETIMPSDQSSHSFSENIAKTRKIESTDDNLDKMILEKLRLIRDSNQNNQKSEKSQQNYSHYDSDSDEHVHKKKNFGLVTSDGTKIPLKNSVSEVKKSLSKSTVFKGTEPKKSQTKKLSDKEKDELRKQMMVDAVKRDKERGDNLKKYRQEYKNEENKIESFDKNFIHKELSKGQNKLTDLESRIKSKLNNIQRSSQHMNTNFSKKS